MTQVEGEHRVYQCNLPERFERLENLTFGGETEVDLDGVVCSVALGADSQGEFYVCEPIAKGCDVGDGGA
jgi:hypothetical protein